MVTQPCEFSRALAGGPPAQTLATLVRSFPCMDPSVTGKVCFIWKHPLASVTAKWLFARVTSFVPGYVACVTAGVRAKATPIWLLPWPSVGLLHTQVVYQGRGPSLAVLGVNAIVPQICLRWRCTGDTANNVHSYFPQLQDASLSSDTYTRPAWLTCTAFLHDVEHMFQDSWHWSFNMKSGNRVGKHGWQEKGTCTARVMVLYTPQKE